MTTAEPSAGVPSVRYTRTASGRTVAYSVSGAGPAVVFVPGTPAGSNLTGQSIQQTRLALPTSSAW